MFNWMNINECKKQRSYNTTLTLWCLLKLTSHKTFGIIGNPFTCSMQNATKISRFSVLKPVNIFAGWMKFTENITTATESHICKCTWIQLLYITSQLSTEDFWCDKGKDAMKEQEDKMVQVSLPWNNFSTVCTPRSVPVSSTAPKHFSTEQINKLESRFSHQKWPDKTGVIIIAMESNLLSKDVEVCSHFKIAKIFNSLDMFFAMYTVCLVQIYMSPCMPTS